MEKDTIMINGETFTQCDGGGPGSAGAHVPIWLPGHFRALCPLCAANQRAADAEETAASGAAVLVEAAEDAQRMAERDRDHAVEKAQRLAVIIENAAERLGGLTPANVPESVNELRADMIEALGVVRRMPGADV